MKSVSDMMTRIMKCLGAVMDFLAAILPVTVYGNLRWNPDDEGPVKYGIYLLAGTVIFCTLCTVICGLAVGIFGLVIFLISVAWKPILIVVLVIMLFILLGCLRIGCLKKGGCDGRHD